MEIAIAVIVWVFFLIAFGAIFYHRHKGKIKYKDRKFHNDTDWLETAEAMYPKDDKIKRFYFHFDKNFLNQGNVLEDINSKVVYEERVLYNNGFQADEVDFVNHIIHYTHHHQIGKVCSFETSIADECGILVNSTFTFDKQDIFEYLDERGYDYIFTLKGLGYTIEVTKDKQVIGILYSTKNNKHIKDKEIVPEMGYKGLYIMRCPLKYLDIMFLFAIMFSRIDFDVSTLKHLRRSK